MENKFLTKNTKISIKEDTNYLTPEPNGLKTAKKVWDEDGTTNKDALKAIAKKLEDYYGDELKELDPIPKVDREDDSGDFDEYEVEALGAGKMSALKYDNEDSEVYEKSVKRIDDLNDNSEYDKNFGTKDGFGETDEKDDTYEKLTKASDEYKKYKYDEPTQYQLTPRVRVTKGVTESKENKKKKMKRLNFKNKFTTNEDMLQLIPENYKTDDHTFLMTDGNKTYKVRWDESFNEGTIIGFKNKSQINEDIQKMKKLFNYDYSDSMGKTNDYVTEKSAFTTMLESVNKTGELILEQDEEVPNGVSGTILPTFEIVSKKSEPIKTLNISYNGENPKSSVKAYDYEYLVYPNVTWDKSDPNKKVLKEVPNSYMVYVNKGGKTLPIAQVGNGKVNQILKGGSLITDYSPTFALIGLLSQLKISKNDIKRLVQTLPTVGQMSGMNEWYTVGQSYATPEKSGKYLTITVS